MRNGFYRTPILTYHRVGAHQSGDLLSVSPPVFERQLAFLTRCRYPVVSLGDLIAAQGGGPALPRRSVVMTFDDSYGETYQIAWPLLKRFHVRATVFVAVAEIGLPGNVTWDQVAEMARNGITIGSHTMHHRYLPTAPAPELAREVTESKRLLEERIGQPVRFLSYPIGGFNARVQAAVKSAGYLAACTTNRAAPAGGEYPYALRRIKITERDRQILMFWAKLSGYYDLFRRAPAPAAEGTE